MKTTLILSFIFVVCVLSAPIAIVQANEQAAPEFSVSFRSSSPQKTSGKKVFEQAKDNGSTTASLVVSGSAVYFGVYDYNKNGYPHELTIFFDVDSDRKTEYYAVFYFNRYGDWYTSDNYKTDVYTIDGYDPEEGIYIDMYFFGYPPMKMGVKVEVYRGDGSLACAYGPDDNTSAVPTEGDGYDVKEDPFATPSSTPSPTPTPAPSVDEIKLHNSKLEGNRLILRKGGSIKISAEALSGGEAISNAEIKAEVDYGEVTVSPSVATTDESGLAEFTITAKKRGDAKIFFTSGDAKKILRVKVK